MHSSANPRAWLIVVALLAAGAGGFEAARMLAKTSPPPIAPASIPTAVDEVIVTDESLAAMQISLSEVGTGTLSDDVDAPATIIAAPSGEVSLTSRARGIVTKIDKNLGDTVKLGTRLAMVESAEAAEMAADLQVAESNLQLAESALARERTLYGQQVTPRQELEATQARADIARAQALRARSVARAAHVSGDGRYISIVSPLAGWVTARHVALGAYVEPDEEMFRVSDPRHVLIQASIQAADAARIAPGDTAVVASATNAALKAVVESVNPTLNDQTRSASVILSPLPAQRLPPIGEFAQARIIPKTGLSRGIIVPESAVQEVNGKHVVFIRRTGGFRVQDVSVAARSEAGVAISAGLKGGEIIAATNAFLLKAELGKGAEDDSE